jgi:hypothetical protein
MNGKSLLALVFVVSCVFVTSPGLPGQSLGPGPTVSEGTYLDLLARVAGRGSPDLIGYLLESSNHLFTIAVGRNMLSFAAENNPDSAVVALFLAAGQEADVPDWEGFTPLMFAAEKGRLETVRLLIAAGANVNRKSESGLTALHLAAGGNKDEKVARLLLGAGADPSLSTRDGLSPGDFAARNPALKGSLLAEELYGKGPGNGKK